MSHSPRITSTYLTIISRNLLLLHHPTDSFSHTGRGDANTPTQHVRPDTAIRIPLLSQPRRPANRARKPRRPHRQVGPAATHLYPFARCSSLCRGGYRWPSPSIRVRAWGRSGAKGRRGQGQSGHVAGSVYAVSGSSGMPFLLWHVVDVGARAQGTWIWADFLSACSNETTLRVQPRSTGITVLMNRQSPSSP